MIRTSTLLLAFLALLTGCASPRLYSWGHYESNLYTAYSAPDKMPPERQVEIMQADFQKARASNRSVPPGWHAHLGCLYYQLGNTDAARQEFEAEKKLFPESAVLMDRMLARSKAK
jgi:hypothetical protein